MWGVDVSVKYKIITTNSVIIVIIVLV
jgi:hypothetical protein